MTPEKRRSFFSILFVTAMDNFGFGLVFVMFAPLMLLPQYTFLPPEASIGVRNFYLGVLFVAFPLTEFFGAPILGDIADRAGRKKSLYLSILGTVFGFLLSGVACLLWSLPLLIISRVISGFFAGNLSICMSAIADLSPTEKLRSRNFGIVTVVWGLSWNFAMLLGGYLSDPTKSRFFNPALPFWVTAALTLLSLVILLKYYTETHPTHQKHPFNLALGIHNIKEAFLIKEVRPFFLLLLFWSIGWGISGQWFGTYSLLEFRVTQEAVSWGLLIQGCFWMIGGAVLNPLLLKRYNSLKIAKIAFIFASSFLIIAGIGKTYFSFCLSYWLAAIFSSFAFSNSMNLASIHAPAAVQGKIMGLSQSMMSLGFVIVPIIGSYLGATNPKWFYPVAGLILSLALFVLLLQKRKKQAL